MNGDGPFATRLRHSWVVCGPAIQASGPGGVTCNRIAIQEKNKVKEMLTPDLVLSSFELNFIEHKVATVPEECGRSQEDRQFLECIEKAPSHFMISPPICQTPNQWPRSKPSGK